MLAMHVRGIAPDGLARAALQLTDQRIDVDDAAAPSFRGLAALAEAGGTTILTGAAEYLALMERLTRATGAEVAGVLVDGASDTLGWFVQGPDHHRQLVHQQGEVVSDEGAALPEEDGSDLDEEALLGLLERRTGITLPWPDDTEAILLAPG